MAGRRIRRRGLVFGLIAMAVLTPFQASAQRASEATVKAAFLYRFGSFVAWPETAFAAPDSALIVCVVGVDPFGRLLDDSIRNQHVGNRPIEVRRLQTAAEAASCHILFVSGGRTQSVEDALRAVRGRPVLTVTDAQSAGNARGIIHFAVVNDRVRFFIDEARAAEGGLTISSRLLDLAISVRPRARP
jgi:hypothetical protein